MSPKERRGLGKAEGVALTIKAGAGQRQGRGVGVDVGGKTLRGISEDTGCCRGGSVLCSGKDSWQC